MLLIVQREGGIDDRLVRGSGQRPPGRSEPRRLRRPGQGHRPLLAHHPGRRRHPGAGAGRRPPAEAERQRCPRRRSATASATPQSVVQAVDDALYTGRDNLPLPPRLSRDRWRRRELPDYLRARTRGPVTAARLRSRRAESSREDDPRPDPAARRAGIPASFITDVDRRARLRHRASRSSRRSRSRAPRAAARGAAARAGRRSTPSSSRGRSPSATGSTTSTSPSSRSTWPPRT